jgi:hypothetical protein
MFKPTCGDCLYFDNGKCSDGGRFFDLSHHLHAGQPRRPDAPACKHFHRLGLPACFHVGGIDPRDTDEPEQSSSGLFSTPPDDPETVMERLASEPYTLEQARGIKAVLDRLAKGNQQVAGGAFERIREAANGARLQLRFDYSPGPKPPRYKLMRELQRVMQRGRLTDEPNPTLVMALAYGAVAAGLLDFSNADNEWTANGVDDCSNELAQLCQLTHEQIREAAAVARNEPSMLRGERGRPRSSALRGFIAAVVQVHAEVSGKPGAPFSRDIDGRPAGPLIDLLELSLRPVHPLTSEGIVTHIKDLR